jgi:integrative and conjugative element protein (TIGR02256 family)
LPGVQEDLVFQNPLDDGFIIVTSSVLRQINQYRQIAVPDVEAGGILLGARRGRHIDITFATTPKLGDRRSRVSFHRFSSFHQSFAVRAWRRFGRRLDYVGEWHTHLERNPSPSPIDRMEWAKLMRSRKSDLVFMILGVSGVWLGVSHHGVVRELAKL